ncbi:hypothetical protein THAOC_10310 [Thalassiosira oceanica]|uniref:Uncharacterized protein n=1 Tax=Thalassiosira oceanica TaxID=159749 RepID=K0TDA6_THAOC|nr:hypothetical protein THAOC_10310 [Thalassiosira oceanica]|eukprot:EJK68502.1 hypothetical protein THAOC_10310 [Thalassiosira oceanica]
MSEEEEEEEDVDKRTFLRVSSTTMRMHFTLKLLNQKLGVFSQNLDDRDDSPSLIGLRDVLRSTMEQNESIMKWSEDLFKYFEREAQLTLSAGEIKEIVHKSQETAFKSVTPPVVTFPGSEEEDMSFPGAANHNGENYDSLNSPTTPETSPAPVREKKKSKNNTVSNQADRPKANDGDIGNGVVSASKSKSKDDDKDKRAEEEPTEGEELVLGKDKNWLQLQQRAQGIVAEVERQFNGDNAVLAEFPAFELVLSRLQMSFDPSSPSLFEVVDIAKDLMKVVRNNPFLIRMFASKDNQKGLQLMARAKRLESDNHSYGYDDSIGSLLAGLNSSTSKSSTEAETLSSDPVTVDLSPFDKYVRALRQYESLRDQDKSGNFDSGATKGEVARLKKLIKYGRLLKLIATNVLHLAVWIVFCEGVSMELLFGGDDRLLRKDAKTKKYSLLDKARSLWNLTVAKTPFDPQRTSLLQYIERALIPALMSHEREALEVAEVIKKYSTDTRNGTKKHLPEGVEADRPTLMKRSWISLESQSLSGQGSTGDATSSQDAQKIQQIATLGMNFLAMDSILSRVPRSVFSGGDLIRELVVLSPIGILRDYDFFCEKWDFFSKTSHSLDTDFIKTIKQNLKDVEEELTEDIHVVIDDRIQIEALGRLVNGSRGNVSGV